MYIIDKQVINIQTHVFRENALVYEANINNNTEFLLSVKVQNNTTGILTRETKFQSCGLQSKCERTGLRDSQGLYWGR